MYTLLFPKYEVVGIKEKRKNRRERDDKATFKNYGSYKGLVRKLWSLDKADTQLLGINAYTACP